ncbi:hypothetical protein ACJZ2D_001779 [Fusarium nematophilum]
MLSLDQDLVPSAKTTQTRRAPCHPDYAFLQQPNTQDVLPQDLAFLVSQGCFVVPHRAALDEFMRQYFLHVHPMLPLLNESDHWLSYNSQESEGHGKMSILVLQGILFISCGFVSLDTIKTLGFRTLQQAKFAFYRRAKLLYDFNCEKSSIAIAQAALLLAHSHLIPLCLAGNKPLGSIWLGVAIHYARDAKAHCYFSRKPTHAADLPRVKKLHNTLKRLWWCCIICDRLLPLTSRQNIKITKSNFNFSGCSVLGSADLAEESYNSDVYDSTTKLFHAEILAKLVELCVILTDVLTVTSVLHNNPSWVLSRKMADTNEASLCKMELDRWYSAWIELRATIDDRMDGATGTKSRATSIILFTNLVEMYYHSARLSLCHYEILRFSLSPQSAVQASKQRGELQSATSRVTECLLELGRLRLTRWLPMTAIGCTAFPLALHLIDLELLQPTYQKSTSQIITVSLDQKQQQLNILLETMSTYRPRYYIADWVMRTVQHVVDEAKQWFPSPSDAGPSRPGLASWMDMLQVQPNYYLRLAMTVDLSISHGKLPDESDFPPPLRQVSPNGIPQTFYSGTMPKTFAGCPVVELGRSTTKDESLDRDPLEAAFDDQTTDVLGALPPEDDASPQSQSADGNSVFGLTETSNGVGNISSVLFDIADERNDFTTFSQDLLGSGNPVVWEHSSTIESGEEDHQAFREFLGELNNWLGVENYGKDASMDIDTLAL